MKALTPETVVYLACGVTDMRAGFERLASMVQEQLNRSVLSGGLYVFVSRCRKRIKLLYWDRDGYALWYKRLEAGAFRIEKKEGSEIITGIDLVEILSGVDLSRIILKKSAEKGLYSSA